MTIQLCYKILVLDDGGGGHDDDLLDDVLAGVLGIPLILLLGTFFMDSGSAASNTHIWVYKGSNRKVKDATVEEVWKRQNPGKSWDKHQSTIYITVTIILCVGFLFLLAKLAGSIFALPTDRPGLRLFWADRGTHSGRIDSGNILWPPNPHRKL